MGITYFTFQLLLGNQSGDRVDNNDINRIGFDQHLCNLHGFFAMVRLTHQKRIQLDTQFFAPRRIESMFGVDHGRNPSLFLGFGRHM